MGWIGRGSRRAVPLVAIAVVATASGCLPGARDREFGEGGFVVRDAVGFSTMAPAADGGVVVSSLGDDRLWRVSPEGVIDPDWSEPLPLPCSLRGDVSRDRRDGYVVTCFSAFGEAPTADVVRFARHGRLDDAFGAGGVAHIAGPAAPTAVVPLRSGGYLGTRPVVEPDGLPVLVVTVLDRHGAVASTRRVPLSDTPLPPSGRLFTDLVPAREGAIVHVGPADFVLRLDRHGDVRQRIDGPWPGAVFPFMGLRSVLELPDGRLVVLGMSDDEPPGPRPPDWPQWFADIFSADGVHERSINLVTPTGLSITPDVTVGSPRGRWLWVAGPLEFPECLGETGEGVCEAIVRYDITTGELDATFGRDGIVALAPDLVRITDIVPRTGHPQMYVTGPSDSEPDDTVITRLWDTDPPPADPTP